MKRLLMFCGFLLFALEAQTLIDQKYVANAKLLELYESRGPNYSFSVFATLILAKEIQKLGHS